VGALSAADRPDPDDALGGQVDAGGGVVVDVLEVVLLLPSLEDGCDGQAAVAQVDVRLDREALMVAQGEAGPWCPDAGDHAAVDHGRLAHEVLGGDPVDVPDLLDASRRAGGVVIGADRPAAEAGQLGEPAAVEDPRRARRRQSAGELSVLPAQAPEGHEQRDVDVA
jgi:hypothetical protein